MLLGDFVYFGNKRQKPYRRNVFREESVMDGQRKDGRSRAKRWCGVAFVLFDVCIVLVHAYWALGGAWGISTGSSGVFPADRSLTMGWRFVTWGLVVLLVAAAALVLGRAEMLRLRTPRWLIAVGCWAIVLVLLGVAATDFVDPSMWSRLVFAPAALVLGGLAFCVALPARKGMSNVQCSGEVGGLQ